MCGVTAEGGHWSLIRPIRFGHACPRRPPCGAPYATLVYDDQCFRLTAKRTLHHAESYAFVVEADGRKIVYSGDVKTPAEMTQLFSGADLGIVELAHFPTETIVEAFKGCDIGRSRSLSVSWLMAMTSAPCGSCLATRMSGRR